MLHMGYVSGILTGKEVVKRLPELVSQWKNDLTSHSSGWVHLLDEPLITT